MARRKWKGTLTENIRNFGDAIAGKEFTFKRGQKVIVWKKRVYDDDMIWNGEHQYHYSDENGKGLVRMSRFLLNEFNEPNLKQ